MKNITILLLLLITISCKAQTINLKNKNGTRIDGAYYKDVDNQLDPFVGTYQLMSNNGNDEMTIVFKKFVDHNNNKFRQDILVGEIKFKKEGVLYFDNLNKINANYDFKHRHDIAGNTLMSNTTLPPCSDCLPNQFRARLIFFGRDNNCGGHVILQKIIENGQEKIKVDFWLDCGPLAYDEPDPVPFIKGGDYILTKLP